MAHAQPRVQFPTAAPEGAPYTRARHPRRRGHRRSRPVWQPGPVCRSVWRACAGTTDDLCRQTPHASFSRSTSDSTWLAGNNTGNYLGVTDLEVSATFALPIFKNPFLVTPGFAGHIWNGPNSGNFAGGPVPPTMPPETYDAYLDTTWKPQLSPRLSADLAVRVGVYTDFVYVTSRSLRTPARGPRAIYAQPTGHVGGWRGISRPSQRTFVAGRWRDLDTRCG